MVQRLPPKRYVWLVEVGWIADHAQRQPIAGLSPDACQLWSWREGGRVAEVALDSLLGPCWIAPDAEDVGRLVNQARSLFVAQSRLSQARAGGVHRALSGFRRERHIQHERIWDGIFTGKLDAAGVTDAICESLALVGALIVRLPQSCHPFLEVVKELYTTVEKRAREDLDIADWALPGERCVLNVPRPFSEAILNISSLDELRSLLPPFTAEMRPTDWSAFQIEQQTLARLMRPNDPLESVGGSINRANQILVEATAGCVQLTTDFGWRLQRIAATSENPMSDCLELFGEAADNRTHLFSPIRLQVVAGLFGLAYLDAGRRQAPCCPDCGARTTPGRRGPRNVLCTRCRTIRRQRSYLIKGT
jgi:hypothetical protein